MIIYGIKNCDVTQKALKWLKANGVEHVFHDYKQEGVGGEKIREWLEHFPVTTLVNTRGTTYRNLSDAEKASIHDTDKLIPLVIANPSLLKRPLAEGKQLLLGFNAGEWEVYK